jgi:predicted acyltransferase
MTNSDTASSERLQSLDIFRGLTMFLLVCETAGVWSALRGLSFDNPVWHKVVTHLTHHEWNGLHFWDLVQPFFMFIVGVAMAFSMAKRTERGSTWAQSLRHIVYRCFMLLMFGVGLHCIYARGLCWELWNVLSQLSVTILIAFLIMQWSAKMQVAISLLLLVATELAFRLCTIEGYDEPFVIGKTFGSWTDMILMGKTSSGGWLAINCIPTAAHTIWGVVAGQWLLSSRTTSSKLRQLLLSGVVLLAVGYGLDWSGVTPIIKRICTSSFVMASGGWCLLTLAFFYWLVDIRGCKRWGFVFIVVGMNPIFIYLFSESIGRQWFNGTVAIFTHGWLQPFGLSEATLAILTASAVLALEWSLCYWLFKRKILIKI